LAPLLLSITLLCLLIQLGFWLGIFSRFGSTTPSKTTELPSLSVLICARNEADNLSAFLPRILEQDYPDYEVVVVDHASTDATQQVLEEFAEQYDHLRIVQYSDSRPGKKGPLAKAWAMARHEWLVLTDADCQPASQQWLRHLAQHMTPDHDFVLGYGAYKPHPGWLNRWVRFETVLTALQYISYARTGIPYMGVGRNLAYRKSLLKKLRPEDLQPHLLSGDDDLLVGRLANAGHVGICLSPEAFTYSSPPDKWPAYFHQKQRHVSTAAHYGRLPQILLSLWGSSQLLWPFTLLILLNLNLNLSLYFLRLLPAWWIFGKHARKLQEGSLTPWFPILDLGLSLYYLWLLPSSLGWKKNSSWK
jgi:glycosyltransferase involved in cell wall biosynthesis